jgi:hypothetical protein
MMNTENFAPTAEQWIARFDTGAQRAIAAWRDGGGQLGSLARERWDGALARSRKQLSRETQRNAERTREAVAGVYAKGIDLSAAGAEAAITALVDGARVAVTRAEAWRATRA